MPLPQVQLLGAVFGIGYMYGVGETGEFSLPAEREPEVILGVNAVVATISPDHATALRTSYGLDTLNPRASSERAAQQLGRPVHMVRRHIMNGLKELRSHENRTILRSLVPYPEVSLGKRVFGAILLGDAPLLERSSLYGRNDPTKPYQPTEQYRDIWQNRVDNIEPPTELPGGIRNELKMGGYTLRNIGMVEVSGRYQEPISEEQAQALKTHILQTIAVVDAHEPDKVLVDTEQLFPYVDRDDDLDV